MSRQFKTDELSKDNAVIWMETVYEMTEKMEKFMTTHDHIELLEHKKFYDEFLVHFLHYRRNMQREYREEIEKYDKEKEIGSSFNLYLLDIHIAKLCEGRSLEEEWQKFIRRADQVNRHVSNSLYEKVINYCFVGSTLKFKNIDI